MITGGEILVAMETHMRPVSYRELLDECRAAGVGVFTNHVLRFTGSEAQVILRRLQFDPRLEKPRKGADNGGRKRKRGVV